MVWICWAVETFTSLALDGNDWNRGTLRDAFDNTLAANGLVNTLSNVRHNSSHISKRLRKKVIDCIYRASSQQSLSVDYVVPDGSNGDGNLPSADPGELLVSPDHHLKKQIFTNNVAMSFCYVPF